MPQPLDVEERLRRHAQSYRREVTPPSDLHRQIMVRADGATATSHPNRQVVRELAIGAAFVLVAAGLAIGLSRLHGAAQPQPAQSGRHAGLKGTVIPWISTAAPPLMVDNSSISTSPGQAAVTILQTVTAAQPLLLPQAVPSNWTAHLSLDAHGFTIQYQDPNSNKLVWLSIEEGNPALPGPHAGGGLRTFRSDVHAAYGIDDVTQPTSHRYLMWNEPGTWSAQPGIGVPYYLTADGLSEANFWQVANSIAPVIMPPACRAANLAAAYDGGNGAGGHVLNAVTLANRGSTACTLSGYPQVILLDSVGHPIAAHEALQDPMGHNTVQTVVLDPGMPVPQGRQPLPGGGALFSFEWDGCPNPPQLATQFRIALAGGTLIVPTGVFGPVGSSNCFDSPTSNGLSVGPFVPPQPPQPGSPEAAPPLEALLTLPARATGGQDLQYTVTLANNSQVPFSFGPCPGYVEILGLKDAVGHFQLNCGRAATIYPEGRVTFAMQLQIAPSASTGSQTLTWMLELPTGDVTATATVTVVAP